MPFNIFGANSVSGYTVKNSLRFNGGSSDYLNRTLGTSTSRRIYTMSAWVKRAKLDVYAHIFTFGPNPGSWDSLRIDSDNRLSMRINNDTYVVSTSALYRDVSAWYHIMCAIDTTQATASNRVRLYVNGNEITAFNSSSYPTQNYDTAMTSGNDFRIGLPTWNTSQNIDSYLSETYFIDGQQLTPSSFGETDTDTGIWKPKAYTGTYGTNGFYLKFANSASLGTDSSGNGNNFTVNNLTSIDQTTDTPTNNFATMNPLFKPTTGTATFTEGNLQLSLDANDYGLISTVGVNKGKWYWEVKWTADSGYDRVGIKLNANPDQNPALSGIGWNRLSTTNGMYMLDSAVSGSWGSAFSVNDIIMFALDCDNQALYIGQNGTWRNSGVPTSGASRTGGVNYSAQSTLTSNYLFPAVGKGNVGTTGFQINFGNPPYSANSYQDANGFGNFSYSVPSGYYSLCTKNLANFG